MNKCITIHHAAHSFGDVPIWQIEKTIRQWHLRKKMRDTAYHYIIHNGQICRGRNGHGAHAGTARGNRSIGICLAYDARILQRLPKVDLDRLKDIWLYENQPIMVGHNFWKATYCPGPNWMPQIYDAIPQAYP